MTEETLDPTNWEAMRQLGHRMVDDMLDYLRTVRNRPVWQPIPPETKQLLKQPLPIAPQAHEDVYREFREHILPHPMGNIHPRFWGWVIGTGTPFGALSEMLAATMNPNVGGGDQGAVYVEQQVLDWCKEMLGFPSAASGILVSGGSMANLVGLTVARNKMAGFDVQTEGVAAGSRKLALYGSVEMHSSIQKAAEILGFGREGVREIPVDANFRIQIDVLAASIAEDRRRGYQPCCVVGNAGAVNTGAIDDLGALADLCEAENLWFHVDGAFGALAALAPDLRPLVSGMERADSLAFDLHKWMCIPYEAGCVLVRHAATHHRSFSASGAYLSHAKRGLSAGDTWFSEYGVQLSRSFRALKVWMSLKEHGCARYGRIISRNVQQARYLADRIEASERFELLAPAPLNVVCFRFVHPDYSEAALDELNENLLALLQESGVAVVSSTRIDGRFALRTAITNHRTRRDDFDVLLRTLDELGQQSIVEPCGATRMDVALDGAAT
ncbi:MAG: aminotransferase class V-fold PLP-dependent enzyme [Chthoniobacterales bacterium]|nr:aminotransferase class V-fold PLP-dependent enzyme [Chthoniobacterales bacterium]